MWKCCTVLLLLALTVNSNETPTPRMCAVCLEKDCANGVRRIYPAGGGTAVWLKANSQTAIQNCCMENLKADAPCKMANGSLVQLADEPLHFEGIDTHDVRRVFNSQISPYADLINSKPSPAPTHNTPTPAAPNNSVADNIVIIGSSICIGIVSIISIIIGVLIWKHNSRGQGQDRDHRHGNKKQPLKGEVANGNVNGVHREDDSVGTTGSLGHCDYYPV